MTAAPQWVAPVYPEPGPAPTRAGAGRPPADPWRELRARAAALCAGGAVISPRPSTPWCDDDAEPCVRGGGTQGFSCARCGSLFFRPMACMGSDCPRCADAVAARRGARCSERMGAPELGTMVLTFPRAWRPYLVPAALLEVERAWKGALNRWALAQLGGRIGGRLFWHPCGDRCERCGHGKEGGKHNRGMGRLGRCSNCKARAEYKPHLNVLIPGIVALPDGEMRAYHLHLGKGQLAALKVEAAALLAAMADVIGRERPPGGQVWWGYRNIDRKKAHSWRYFARPFPAWKSAMPHLGRDFGLQAGQDKPGTDLRARYRAACRKAPTAAAPLPCPHCAGPLDGTMVLFGKDAEFWRRRAVLLPEPDATGRGVPGAPAPPASLP